VFGLAPSARFSPSQFGQEALLHNALLPAQTVSYIERYAKYKSDTPKTLETLKFISLQVKELLKICLCLSENTNFNITPYSI
jgi:hypothetical protein